MAFGSPTVLRPVVMVTSQPAPISNDFTSLLPVSTVPAAALAVPQSPPPVAAVAVSVVEAAGELLAGVLTDDVVGVAAAVAAELLDDEQAAAARPATQTMAAKRERWSMEFTGPPEGTTGGPRSVAHASR
jgi:hypothetical protein